jgi:hypothetical protein
MRWRRVQRERQIESLWFDRDPRRQALKARFDRRCLEF